MILDDEEFHRGQQRCLHGPCHCPCDLLRCVTYDVMFLDGRAYAIVLRLSVVVVCPYGMYCG